uniref:Ion channel nompc n=1 Tax=Anopheles dirus TaxID=7168 RepID=A0A182MXB5_9DIPT
MINNSRIKCCISSRKNVRLSLPEYTERYMENEDYIVEALLASAINKNEPHALSYMLQKTNTTVTNKLIIMIMRLLPKENHYHAVKALQYLLDKTTDLYSVDEEGRNLLHMIAQNGCYFMMHCLVAKGFDISLVNPNNRWNVFHYAASRVSIDMLRPNEIFLYLVKCVKDYEVFDTPHADGYTVLDRAIITDHNSMAREILLRKCQHVVGCEKRLSALLEITKTVAHKMDTSSGNGGMGDLNKTQTISTDAAPTLSFSVKPQPSTLSATKSRSTLHGSSYHLQLALVMLLRAFKMYQADNEFDFNIIMEDPAGGKFDDIVFRYSSPKRCNGTVYIQAKHKQLTASKDIVSIPQASVSNTQQRVSILRESDLLAAWDSNSSFSIPMYFISFLEVEQLLPEDSKTYVLCTNRLLDVGLRQWFVERKQQQDDVLHFCYDIGGTCYQFNRQIPFMKLEEILFDSCLAKLGKAMAQNVFKFKIMKFENWVFIAFASLINDCVLFQNIDDPGTVCIFLNDAGCGKSTFFTWLAWRLSTNDPTRFVVRLNALEYSTDFERFESSGLQNFDDTQIVRILYRLIHLALFVPNVNKRTVAEADVERNVADRCAQLLTITNGRIVVDEVRAKELLPNHLIELRLFREKFNGQRLVLLLDGFDEIAPNFKDIVLKCFARFAGFEGLRNIYISSRPYDFEDEFEEIFNDCSIFRLQPFSRSDEIISLHKFLLHQLEDYVKLDSDQRLQLLTVLHATVSEVLRDMTTIPLLLHMVLRILLPEIRQNVYFSSQTLSPRLLRVFSETNYDMLTLVEHFVDQQLAILNLDKTGTTDSSAKTVTAKGNYAKLNKQIKRQHVLLAMYVMFDGKSRTALLSEEEQEDASELMEEVSRAEEKTGIVTGVRGGVPQFAHRMFAEYFAACWLHKNKARMRRESIFRSQAIWGYTLQRMREFFDRMILRESDGCELHKAVLDQSVGKLSLLIYDNASLITVTDAAGRTPVHLCGKRAIVYDQLIKATPPAILNAKDKLFEWTALDYAFILNDGFVIEALLKHGVLINIDTLQQQLSSNDIDDAFLQGANYGFYLKMYGARQTGEEMYTRVVQHLLIERQLDIFAPRDKFNSLSVLEFCTRWNRLDLFQEFVSQTGPPVQVLKSMADRLLQLAFENKAHEMVTYLIEYYKFSLPEVNHIRGLACAVESTAVKNQMSLFKLLFHQLCVQSRIAFVDDDGIIDEIYNKNDNNVEIIDKFENKCCVLQSKNVKLPLPEYCFNIDEVEDGFIFEYLLARAVNEGNLPMTSYITQKVKLPITNRLIVSIMRQLQKSMPFCHANCTPVFNYLLSKTTDLHSVDEEGRNLLHMTVQNGCVYMLPCLFAKGFNPVEMNANNRWNVFHYLASSSYEYNDRAVKILYYLLQHTPRDSLDSVEKENNSVLSIAITNVQFGMAIALIQLMSDNRTGSSKLTALCNAIERLARTHEPEVMKGFVEFCFNSL